MVPVKETLVKPDVYLQTATQQQAEARERDHHHQERLMEDMVEDPDMDEKMVHVVDHPVQYAAHNPAGGAGDGGHSYGRWRGYGHGHGYSRWHGNSHGRSRSFHRGQGNFGTGQWGGQFVPDRRGQDPQGQFYEGDLPPRFRR